MPVNNQKISGETPFKPEYDEFINEYRGRGSLKVQTSVAREAFPIKNAFVDVALIYKGKRYSIYNDVTDNSGPATGSGSGLLPPLLSAGWMPMTAPWWEL